MLLLVCEESAEEMEVDEELLLKIELIELTILLKLEIKLESELEVTLKSELEVTLRSELEVTLRSELETSQALHPVKTPVIEVGV